MRREGRQGLFLLLEQGPRFSPCTAAAPLGPELTCILSLPRSMPPELDEAAEQLNPCCCINHPAGCVPLPQL